MSVNHTVNLHVLMFNLKRVDKTNTLLRTFEKDFGEFCSTLNVLIGAETDVNYRILIPKINFCKRDSGCYYKSQKKDIDVYFYEGTIEFNIELNTIERISQTKNLRQKLKTISEFLENINWNEQQLEHQRIIAKFNMMFNLGFRLQANLKYKLQDEDLEHTEPIDLNFNLTDNVPKIRQIIKNNSAHVYRNICDRFISDYGLYINLSKPFSVFNLGYNYLHVYEHLMTYAWKGLPKDQMKQLNGFTTINGNCAIYVVLSSKKALELYLNNYLKFCKEIILTKNWPGLECEMNRTISETLNEKSLTSFGRTDPSINLSGGMKTIENGSTKTFSLTGGDYNEKVFNEFIIDNLNILVVSPELVDFDVKLFNEVSSLIDKRTEMNAKTTHKHEIKFDYFPLSVCLDKATRFYQILPKELECKNDNKHGQGIDTQIYTRTPNLYSIYIDELMFADGKKLRDYLNTHMLPESNLNLL